MSENNKIEATLWKTAWHLKDWIINDETVVKDNIEEIAKNYTSLMICAGMANRTKHYTLTNIRRDA
jgi:hypothetical protein